MATKWFENISVNPKDVTDLKELIPLSIDQDEDYQKFTALKKVRNGDPVAFLGDGDDVGIAGSGCDPTYEEYGVANSQKRWELGDWQIPLKICYESLQGTIAEYSLHTGTSVGDITGTEFLSYILRPALERQMKRMIWRFGWFGNKEASVAADGGTLTAGTRKEMFTTCDGLFKKIFAQCAKNADQLTTIAANSKTTYAEQKSAILTEGVATGVFDKLLMDADSRITADPGAVILVTKALADALTYDTKKVYKVIMPWEKVFEGIDVAQYNGVQIVRVSIWDRMIKAYENTGTALNKPYRAVYANVQKELQTATDADGLISDLDIWFDKKERRNYVYSTGRLGTMILEDDMFQAAY